jgi:type I restriction enzyme S subunit
MNKQEKKDLVPKRRFPEFRGKAAWELKDLGECLDYLQPTNYLVSSTAYDDQYETPVLTAGKTFILGYTNETMGIFDKKLPVIIFDDFTTASKYVDFPFKAKSSAMKILLAKDINIKFAYESMQMVKYEVGVHERHWISTFSKIKIPVPHEKEQQKIAECLSSVDELIAAQSQKLVVLKAHKKSLMQQLFAAEGETVPKRRFPQFQDTKEWEPTTMGQIADFKSGGTPSKGNPDFWNGSIPWASAKDMKQLFLDDTEDHITTAAVDAGAKPVPAGTVLMLTRGMTLLKDVPICFLNRQMSYNQDVKALLPKRNFDGRFLAYLLLGCKQRLLNLVDIAGHGTGRLDTDKLKALEVMLPQPAEQQQIADCLSSLDDLLHVQNIKINTLQAHKKGLMQQLFPTMNGVNG